MPRGDGWTARPRRFRYRWEAVLIQRTVSHVANGVLLYALFYGLVWLLLTKGSLLAHVTAPHPGGTMPALLGALVIPFLVSAFAAFTAHAGLRLALKRLRLKLSSPESVASRFFLGVLTVLAFSGALTLFDSLDTLWYTPVMIVAGAWTGVALRRRIPI